MCASSSCPSSLSLATVRQSLPSIHLSYPVCVWQIDDIVAAAEVVSRARPAATTAAQDAQAAARAQQQRVEQLDERVAPATAGPGPATGDDSRATAARLLAALHEELGGISTQLDAFVERAESGGLRVSSVRAASVCVEDEKLTQLMLKLDAVPLPPGDEELRTARRELVQHVHQLSTRLTDTDAAAAAHAESPEEICETRRQEGCAAYSRGEYDLAIESFTEAISEATDERVSALCRRQRAASLCAAGYYVRGLADTMFDDSGEAAEPEPDGDGGPHADTSSAHTTACTCLRQLGRLSEAGTQLQLALAAGERGATEEAHMLQETENVLARVAQFVMAGQPALALDSLLPVQDRPAGTCVAAPEVTAALASIRLRLGDLDGAAAGYARAAQQADEQPSHATSRMPAEWKREAEIVHEGIALKAKGNERFKAKNFEGAVAAYEQAIALLPMVAPLHTNLAAGLAQADGGTRQFDAVCACEAALAIDQSSLKARVRRATCLSSLGRHEEALDEMGTAMEMAPGNKEVMEKMQLLELAAGIAAEDEDDVLRRYGGGGEGHDGATNHAGGGGGGGGKKKKKKSRAKKKK